MTDYCTLAEFRARFASSSATANDASITAAITAASRLIDKKCGRTFTLASSTAVSDSVRYFTPEDPRRCYIDDLYSITSLETDDDGDGTIELTWAATDYVLLPTSSYFGWPYTWVEIMPEGDYTFPKRLRNGVKITGKWGWAAVPDEIREATLLQSNRIWSRRGAPFGVLGANEFGAPTVITKLDPDIEVMVEPFVRLV